MKQLACSLMMILLAMGRFAVAATGGDADLPSAVPEAPAEDGERAGTAKNQNDFVVSGEDRLKVRSDKLLRVLFVDVDKPIQEIMQESSKLSQEILPNEDIVLNEKAGMISDSRMTFSPWLTLINKQPLLVIQPQKLAVKIKSWKFVVSDETGTVLFERRGGGSLPGKFIWDGRAANGHLLTPGESYFYSNTIIDQAGNPLFTSSKPRQLNSLAFYENNNLNVSLLSSLIFDKAQISSLSPIGQSLMNETCDYIAKDIGRLTQITVVSTNPKLGEAQGAGLKEFIIRKLALPKSDVKVAVAIGNDPTQDYVNIVCLR